jgi:hypothetical protein
MSALRKQLNISLVVLRIQKFSSCQKWASSTNKLTVETLIAKVAEKYRIIAKHFNVSKR